MTEGQQRLLLGSAAVLVAVSRFFALSRSLWDWDEALFCSALRHYNVGLHHPHPPGFPLFVGMGKLAHLVIADEFHALRAVVLLFSILTFPSLYAFARALRFDFQTSFIAALLFSFIPNVWFWGGTAFSDIPAIVCFLFGGALLLDDDRRRSYLAGCALFAASLLIRPQNVVMSYPWFAASWRRIRAGRRMDAALGASLLLLLLLAGYGAAASVTGVRTYIAATSAHQKYVTTVDGTLNPARPPIAGLLHDFAVDPFDAGRASVLMFAFALIALLPPRRPGLRVLATFVPNFVITLLLVNPTGISRLSLGYMPMHALLASDGLSRIGELAARPFRARRFLRTAAHGLLAAVLIVWYIRWVWPALYEVRRHDSPPAAVLRWIQQHVPVASGKIYVHGSLSPQADFFLSRYRRVAVADGVDPLDLPPERDAWYVAAGRMEAEAVSFHRDPTKLWALFLRRYFDSYAVRAGSGIRFGEGWHDPEEAGSTTWRWMTSRSETLLGPLNGPADLSLRMYAPLDAESAPAVTVRVDGQQIDRFVMDHTEFARVYRVHSRSASPDSLVIEVDRVVNPARLHLSGDTRDLGLRLQGISWRGE